MKPDKEQAGKPGFVLLYRSLTDKGYYKDSQYVHLWIHILMRANHSLTEVMHCNSMIKLLPGQFITGREKLAQEIGANPSKIERMLKCFENEQQIKQETFSKYRIITVIQWDAYQNRTGKRTASEQHVNTEKELKELNNNLFDQFYSNYPKKVSKGGAKRKFNALAPEVQLKCIDAAKAYAEECKRSGTELRFIKHPTTWLNQGCWDDETSSPQLPDDCPYTPDDIRRLKTLHASGNGLPTDFDRQYKHLITG
jgi:hypothetical protein